MTADQPTLGGAPRTVKHPSRTVIDAKKRDRDAIDRVKASTRVPEGNQASTDPAQPVNRQVML